MLPTVLSQHSRSALTQLLSDLSAAPERVAHRSLSTWDTVLRQARQTHLVARLAGWAAEAGVDAALPEALRFHGLCAQRLVEAQHRQVHREVQHLRAVLTPEAVPLILLKGAAYVLAAGPAQLGRSLTDIDILVPFHQLSTAESALRLHGWVDTHTDPYDQAYYRRWMHELPPLVHLRRGTAVDVHHALLPRTAARRPASALLLDRLQSVGPGVWVLHPQDQVLHSMAHLLFNEDLRHGLRDLTDMHRLLRHCCPDEAAWMALLQRAQVLDLAREFRLALGLLQALLGTPVPTPVWQAAGDAARQACGSARGTWTARETVLWRLWLPLLDPTTDASTDAPAAAPHPAAQALRRLVITARAHALRMPPHLLLPHLLRKAWRQCAKAHTAEASEP